MRGPYDFSVDNPRQAEILSYIQGLAPAGTPIELCRKQIMADLSITARVLYDRLDKLVQRGFLARRPHENLPKRRAIVVLKRLEQIR